MINIELKMLEAIFEKLKPKIEELVIALIKIELEKYADNQGQQADGVTNNG